MLILPTFEAQPGMKLAVAVPHPQHPDTDLLKAGYLLEPTVIARLKALGVENLYIDYPGLEDLDKHLGPLLSPARQTVYKQIKESIESTQRAVKPVVSYSSYYDSTRELISTLLLQGPNPIFVDQMSRVGGDMIAHSMAVAHLSLMLGIKLEAYLISERPRLNCSRAKDVVSLGVAGMLHDIGKTKLPENIRNLSETDAMSPDDAQIYQSHAREGYEMVHSAVEPSTAAAVLHHHQHFDGSGFPIVVATDGSTSKPAEKRIHIFARILQAADLFDRLSMDGKKRRSNLDILRLMYTQYRSWLDPEVLSAVKQLCPPYMPGTRVTLSDGRQAVVARINPSDPMLPVLKILNKDLTLSPDLIDLKKTPQLKIVDPNEPAKAA